MTTRFITNSTRSSSTITDRDADATGAFHSPAPLDPDGQLARQAREAPLVDARCLGWALGVSEETAGRLVKLGAPHVLVDRAPRFKIAAVAAWLEKRGPDRSKPDLAATVARLETQRSTPASKPARKEAPVSSTSRAAVERAYRARVGRRSLTATDHAAIDAVMARESSRDDPAARTAREQLARQMGVATASNEPRDEGRRQVFPVMNREQRAAYTRARRAAAE